MPRTPQAWVQCLTGLGRAVNRGWLASAALNVSLPGGTVRLEADPVRLEQVIVNLLKNSSKFTDPGERISLSY